MYVLKYIHLDENAVIFLEKAHRHTYTYIRIICTRMPNFSWKGKYMHIHTHVFMNAVIGLIISNLTPCMYIYAYVHTHVQATGLDHSQPYLIHTHLHTHIHLDHLQPYIHTYIYTYTGNRAWSFATLCMEQFGMRIYWCRSHGRCSTSLQVSCMYASVCIYIHVYTYVRMADAARAFK
jgi:hypothetical protein